MEDDVDEMWDDVFKPVATSAHSLPTLYNHVCLYPSCGPTYYVEMVNTVKGSHYLCVCVCGYFVLSCFSFVFLNK